MNIFQTKNKNQRKRWGDWLIDSSQDTFTIQNERTWHTHKTGQKKLLKNKNMCTVFFFLFNNSLSPPIFGKSIATVFFPFYFGNSIATIFFSFFFGNAIATIFFPLYFSNAIATNQLPPFFFPFISAMPLSQINCRTTRWETLIQTNYLTINIYSLQRISAKISVSLFFICL